MKSTPFELIDAALAYDIDTPEAVLAASHVAMQELFALLDEANDCVLECLNVVQAAKRPSYGAIAHLRNLHERVTCALSVPPTAAWEEEEEV